MVKTILITLAIFATVNVPSVYGFNTRTIQQINMGNDLTRSANPQVSVQCFTVYSPQLSAVTKEYETQYANCLEAAENYKEIINKEVAANYTTVLQLGRNVCSRFSQCTQSTSDSYGFFECNNDGASEAITMSYNIQTISKDRMEYIDMRSQMVTYDLNACTAKSSQKYIEDYAEVYGKLQACLDGKIPAETTTSDSVTSTTVAGQ